MLLSELIYLAVKNVIYYDDDSFNYETFMEGKWRNSADYGNTINNILTPINEAFSRLLNLDKVPHKMVEKKPEGGFVTLPDDVYELIGVGVFFRGKAYSNSYENAGLNRISVEDMYFYPNRKVSVEYKPNLHFANFTTDVNLKTEYGLTDNLLEYVIEYAEGKLLEQISPDEANMHITRSEAYFSGLPTVKTTFVQKVVESEYKIGE